MGKLKYLQNKHWNIKNWNIKNNRYLTGNIAKNKISLSFRLYTRVYNNVKTEHEYVRVTDTLFHVCQNLYVIPRM